MEPYTNEQIAAIEAIIDRHLRTQPELILKRIFGLSDLDIEAAPDKDINLNTFGDGKAYYNSVELGAVTGDADTLDTLHASSFMRKDAGAGSQTQNNLQVHKANIQMDDFMAVKMYGDSTYLGYVSGAASFMSEGHWHYGVKMMSQVGPTTSAFYIGETPSAIPNGVAIVTDGLYLTDTTGIFLMSHLGIGTESPDAAAKVDVVGGGITLDNNTAGYFLDDTSGVPRYGLGRFGTNHLTLTNRALNGDLILMANNGVAGGEIEGLRIASPGGHVGIGIAPGSNWLTVADSILIKDDAAILKLSNNAGNVMASLSGVSATLDAYLASPSGHLYIETDTASKNIVFRTGATPTTRLTIADSGITAAAALAMGANKITGLAAATVAGDAVRFEQLTTGDVIANSTRTLNYLQKWTNATTKESGNSSISDDGSIITMGNHIHMGDKEIDFRTDSVHKVYYYSTDNSLRISSYDQITFALTNDSSYPIDVAADGIRLTKALFFRKNHAADDAYIVDDGSGTLEFHANQKFKFIIG